jgi:uncharacterized membrane protein YphA (DoxX/SURF4 family)
LTGVSNSFPSIAVKIRPAITPDCVNCVGVGASTTKRRASVTCSGAAGPLAVVFAIVGLLKITTPREKLLQRMGWVSGFSQTQVRGIGTLEVLGAVGVILPGITKIVPVLVPIAATGLALLMIGASITHIRRKEYNELGSNVVLFALAVFVAWGRFGPYPL